MDPNPYATPTASDPKPPDSNRRIARGIGTAILAAGLVVLAYGAVAFWLVQSLPPNGGASGRLPSLYVMGVGILGAIIGMVVRDVRLAGPARQPDGSSRKGVPTSVGILILLAIVIAAIVVIAQL
jgi:hypothetical protein